MQKYIKLLSAFIFFTFLTIKSKKPNIYICTGVYCDPVGEESLFSNTDINPKASSSDNFQNIYWNCAFVLFASSFKHNKNAKHLLFSNKKSAPKGFDAVLNMMNVDIITIPFAYKIPKGFYHAFQNTFFLFDIITYLAQTCQDDDIAIITDADCFWIKPATSLIKEVEQYGTVNYFIDYAPDHIINGLSRSDYKKLYSDLLNTTITTLPKHAGGELIASTGRNLKKIAAEIDPLWQTMMQKFKNGEQKFNTEEHFLSFIYHKLGLTQSTQQIKRIWTLGANSITGNEDKLTIWHMPEQKTRGNISIAHEILQFNGPFWQLPQGNEFIHFCNTHFNILSA